MSASLMILWVVIGWCGTVPHPLLPPPPIPDPGGPIYWISRVIGVVSGVIGGSLYTRVFLPQDPIPIMPGIHAAATAVGAFALARIITDVYAQITSRRS